MSEPYTEDKPAAYMPISAKQLAQIAVVGIAVGLVTWGVAYVLDMYLLRSVVCQGAQAAGCASAQYAEVIATILAAGIGLFALIKLQVFRPLLVVLAASASMWGLTHIVAGMPLYGAALSCIVLYMIAYVAFTWIARLRLFWLVAVLLLVIIVATRLILSA